MRCCDCMYWKEGQDHRVGECHRYAPRPIMEPKRAPDVWWPMTTFNDGCGEALRRADIPAQLESLRLEP